ncbi:MAG: hypothetical protein WDW38_001749 [Sanguina aurantia]
MRSSGPLRAAAAAAAGEAGPASAVAPPLIQTPPSAPASSTASSGSKGSNGHSVAHTPPAPPQQAGGYRLPPKEILDIVDAAPQPGLSFSPDQTMILQTFRPPNHPPISELSRAEIKLAGLRVDPAIHARSKMGYTLGMSIVSATEVVPAPAEKLRPIFGYPEGSWLNYISWSPDNKFIAFTVRSPGGPTDPPQKPLELWIADVSTGSSRMLLESPAMALNTMFDDYCWLDDNTIVATVLPAGLGAPPVKPLAPAGPKIQDNSSGKKSQNRTYPDLLKDAHDVALFEHYGLSEIIKVDVISGAVTKMAPSRLYTSVDPSPDGLFLIVSWLEAPYSFQVPCGRFPKRVQLWDAKDGSLIREMAALPLAEDIPIAFNSVRVGPRGVGWRDDMPAEMYWVETQDGGDPAVDVNPRDIVYTLPASEAHLPSAAPTAAATNNGNGVHPTPSHSHAPCRPPTLGASPRGDPRVIAATELRYGGIAWCDGDLALVYESWWKTRRSVVWTIAPDRVESEPASVLFDRNYEDVYTDPGSPLSRRTALGTYILAKLDGERKLLMSGGGASPEGNKPFLDVLDLSTKSTERLWQSAAPYYEQLGGFMNDTDPAVPIKLEGLQMMLARETAKDPPQSYIKTFSDSAKSSTERVITQYPHPYPQLRDMQREVLRYPRNDGVMLTGTLYLPPDYVKERDGPLPCIMWAYPREFKSKEAAGQMRRSSYQFSSVGSMSPMLWVTRGYAVLDGPTFPIVAEGTEEPNDTFVEQLTAGAAAAIQEVVSRGVVDPKRISVGGHSYGAFMAANLLAHAPEMFACGIARTGAYNRTLTPFGFQNEERTLWQAPDVYARMSPFMNADKIKAPLLLMHGEEDNNPGTFPMQSERFYQALKGHGSPARMVLLPHESHGYTARESVLHTLYEQDQFFEKFAGFGRVDPAYLEESGESSE